MATNYLGNKNLLTLPKPLPLTPPCCNGELHLHYNWSLADDALVRSITQHTYCSPLCLLYYSLPKDFN